MPEIKYRHHVLKPTSSSISERLIAAARDLSSQMDRLKFRAPVTHVYNPLAYAWSAHAEYLRRFGNSKKRIVFLGMNPGPFGMAQTGVPFGEIAAVSKWMGIYAPIGRPAKEHPKRPVRGYDCPRSEVSGRRFWGLHKDRFITPEKFFTEHFAVNYCPLAFMEESGLNRTPDKLPHSESERLFQLCDEHLSQILILLQPEWLIGVGVFAKARAELVSSGMNIRIGKILHPAPANPAANRGWAAAATNELIQLGVWQ